MDNIRIMKRNSDITVMALDLFKKNKVSLKFKTKLYYEGFNTMLTYFHQEFIYNSNKQANRNINLTPNSFIQLSLNGEEKANLFITEVSRNKILRKIQKLVFLIEAYDAEDIDIVSVGDSGSYISNKYGDTSVSVAMNKTTLTFSIILDDDTSSVRVVVAVGDIGNSISVYDFLDLIYKLRGVNYMSLTMQMIQYLGRPPIGEFEVDLRESKIDSIDDCDEFMSVSSTQNDIGLETKPREVIKSGKQIW